MRLLLILTFYLFGGLTGFLSDQLSCVCSFVNRNKTKGIIEGFFGPATESK